MIRNGYLLILLGWVSLSQGATSAPSIDGYLDDDFWQKQARIWTTCDPDQPENLAQFRIGCDENFFYFAADVNDSNVTGMHKGRKNEVWLDDCVEIFIDFGDGKAAERTPETFEYGFSAAGGVNWTRGTGDGSGKNYPAYEWPPSWDSSLEWSTRLKIGTTINFSADRDTGYAVEARIPWSELGQSPPFDPQQTVGLCFLNIRRPGAILSALRGD